MPNEVAAQGNPHWLAAAALSALWWAGRNALDIFGLVAGGAGVWFAKRASEAAADARNQLRHRNRFTDVGELRRVSDQLLQHSRANETAEARLRADDLLAQLNTLRAFYRDQWTEDSDGRLLQCLGLARSVVKSLQSQPNAKGWDRTLEAVRQIHSLVNEQFGDTAAEQDKTP